MQTNKKTYKRKYSIRVYVVNVFNSYIKNPCYITYLSVVFRFSFKGLSPIKFTLCVRERERERQRERDRETERERKKEGEREIVSVIEILRM